MNKDSNKIGQLICEGKKGLVTTMKINFCNFEKKNNTKETLLIRFKKMERVTIH